MKKSDIHTVEKLKQKLLQLEKLNNKLSFELDNIYVEIRRIENQRKENFRQRCDIARELEKFRTII